MSELLITPVDESTGIPLPLYPQPELPIRPGGKGGKKVLEGIADDHHPFHPRSDLLGRGLGAEALRHCRIQWADYDEHHNSYHNMYVGPPLPQSQGDKFRTVVFAAAGYIPAEAIRFVSRGDTPKIAPLTATQRMGLLQSGNIRIEQQKPLKMFLLDYLMKHGLSEVAEGMIDEFLNTGDFEKAQEIGNALLHVASNVTTDPFSSEYINAIRERLLPRRSAKVGNFVCNLILTESRGLHRKFLNQLKGTIGKNYEVSTRPRYIPRYS